LDCPGWCWWEIAECDPAADRQAQAAFRFWLDHGADEHGDSRIGEAGSLQLSLLDQKNLAEIASPDYPGERLMICHNPLLEQERKRKRQALLEATEKSLEKISKEVARRKKKPLQAVEIGMKSGSSGAVQDGKTL